MATQENKKAPKKWKHVTINVPANTRDEMDQFFDEAEEKLRLINPDAKLSKSKTICRWIEAGMASDRT